MRDWDDHRLILTLHRLGTLRATGLELGVTHTTVARRLAALEAREPTRVFMRQGRSYRATPYGLERVALAERMEALDFAASRLERQAGNPLSGPLSVSIPQAVLDHLLLDAVAAFVRDYPDIELSVTGTDRLADLDRGEADVVIRGHRDPPSHLVGRRIGSVGLSYYAHRDYLAETPREHWKWLSPSKDADWIAASPCPDAPIGYVIHDIQSRFLALKQGHGLSRAACFMADPLDELVKLDGADIIPRYDLWVLTHPDLRSSPKVQALMRTMSETLSERAEQIAG